MPMRIDFIFASSALNVIDFQTHGVKLSDHKPISAKFGID
jgi:endonuclease/exonuclease/phosphatase (EEP) superfamily protein YafD